MAGMITAFRVFVRDMVGAARCTYLARDRKKKRKGPWLRSNKQFPRAGTFQ